MPARISDIVRQSLVVIGAVTLPLASRISEIVGFGRSISDQSDGSDTLLVPAGIAFAIWGPIFLGILAYAIIQGLPRNRTRALFRDTGWWMAGALGGLSLWGLAAAFPPLELSRWLTAVIFVPATLMACVATVILSRRKAELSALEGWLVWMPVSVLAGWCSIATFLNWAQLGVNGGLGFGLSELVVSLLALALALAFIAFVIDRTRGNRAYTFAPVWGLALLAYARLAVDDLSTVIAGAAILGALALMASAVHAGRKLPPIDI